MPAQRRHRFVPRRIQHPALQIQPSPDLQQRVDRALLIAQILHPYGMCGITRIPGNRPLIINDADGNTLPAEAARYSQTLKITADDNSANPFVRQVN